MQLKDGSIPLHQAVLLPLSPLISSLSTSKEMPKPLELLLPDYSLSTAIRLVSLLYTGSCIPESTASYQSLLSMVSSMGLNLSPSSLVFSDANTPGYHHKKFRSIVATDDDDDPMESLSSDVQEEDKNANVMEESLHSNV